MEDEVALFALMVALAERLALEGEVGVLSTDTKTGPDTAFILRD